MPHIWIFIRERRGWDLLRMKYTNVNSYECPLYTTTKRTSQIIKSSQIDSWILDITLPYSKKSQNNADVWSIRGTSLIAQLDD